jgi:predicted DNA-binding transcriptional regulator YafY
MGQNKSGADTLLRQWHMFREIPRYPQKITVSDLKSRLGAAGFEVTARTIQRDLNELSEEFPLHSDDRERPFGWSWQKDAPAFDIPNLSNQEALAFAMIERYLRPLLPHALLDQLNPYFGRAKARLGKEAPTRGSGSWLGKIAVVQPTQTLIPPKVDAKVQAAVADALLLDRRLRIRYRRKGEQSPKEYVLSPLGLVQRGPMTYVVGMPWDYDDVRTFALHRIQQATMLDQHVKRPKGFSLEARIAAGMLDFGAGETIRLEAIFETSAAEHLSETPLSADQIITPVDDGHVRLEATVVDTPQLSWWLLGFGSYVEVVAPAGLRQEFATVTAAMATTYAPGGRKVRSKGLEP